MSDTNKKTPATSHSDSVIAKTTDIREFVLEADASTDTKAQGRAIMIVIAIIALIFINAGIFYTTHIARETDKAIGSLDPQKVSTSTLDTTTLNKLSDRISVDVEAKLEPTTSGRTNPFAIP